MTEGQTLFIVLGFLYLSDCFVWIGRSTAFFFSRWCHQWRVSFAGEYFGNIDGNLVFLNPLPPLGKYFWGHFAPASISPTGVCAFTLQAIQETTRSFQTGFVLEYEEISDVKTDGKLLLLNGFPFTKCSTVEQADSFAELIKKLSSESIEKREELLQESLLVQFAKHDALDRLALVNDLTRVTRWTCSAFFVFLYVITPILVSVYGLNSLVIPTAFAMLLSSLIVSYAYFHAHKTLYPLRPHDRLSNVVKMILFPPSAIRAADLLTLNSMSKFHPLLLANLLLDSNSLVFARTVINDLKYPIRHDLSDPRALSIISWHAAYELNACMQFMETQTSISMNDLLAPPTWDNVSSTYCPRCLCQFTKDVGECPDCPGVELLVFSVARTPEAKHE